MLSPFPDLYLASKSPRRQELLRAAAIPFRLLDVDVEEDYPDQITPEEVPVYLARKKAKAAIPLLEKDSLVLTADSVVILDHVIYGKPTSQEEAKTMVRNLAGKKHLVITGVYIGNGKKEAAFSEHTYVWVEPMSDDEVDYYVTTWLPLDKAGAYGIQDWIGWTRISRIKGSYANVMGLPVHRVYEVLSKWSSI